MRPSSERRRHRHPDDDDGMELGDMTDRANRLRSSKAGASPRWWRRTVSVPRQVAAGLVMFIVSGCAGTPVSPAPSSVAVSPAPSTVAVSPASSTVAVSPAAATSPTPTLAQPSSSVVVGSWTRTQSCQAMLAAFIKAGLADQVQSLVVPNFVPQGASAPSGHECENAGTPVDHTHFFTADGGFGSRDQNGQQVDGGDYVLVDGGTLSFPSHARDFGFAGSILVGFTVTADTMTFRVRIPSPCEGACRVAYGWALSAFYGPTPFQRSGG